MKDVLYLLSEYARSKMKGNLGHLTSALETRLGEAKGMDKTKMRLPGNGEKNCESPEDHDSMYMCSLGIVPVEGKVSHNELRVFVCPKDHKEPLQYVLNQVVRPIVQRWVKFCNGSYCPSLA